MEPIVKDKKERSLKNFFIAGAAVLAAYCAGVVFSGFADDLPGIIFVSILLIMMNFILHMLLCVSGKIAWYALPFWWAACVFPLYIASYHIISPSFFGRDFTFIILGMFTLLPPLAVSLLISLIYLWCDKRKKTEKNVAK